MNPLTRNLYIKIAIFKNSILKIHFLKKLYFHLFIGFRKSNQKYSTSKSTRENIWNAFCYLQLIFKRIYICTAIFNGRTRFAKNHKENTTATIFRSFAKSLLDVFLKKASGGIMHQCLKSVKEKKVN